ncbi:hypothetical protein [Sulfolobus sp. S-194]|nr:hypothetical protein [Sulfolobus sp. S-194]
MLAKKKNYEQQIIMYDLAKLPDEYLKNEYPEYYNTLKKRKYEDPLAYLL